MNNLYKDRAVKLVASRSNKILIANQSLNKINAEKKASNK